MSDFPEIPGLKWIMKTSPDLIGVKIMLCDKDHLEMDVPNLEEIESIQYLDFSKICGVRHFYPKKEETFSSSQCMIDVQGIGNFVAEVSLPKMMKAWIFYKQFNQE